MPPSSDAPATHDARQPDAAHAIEARPGDETLGRTLALVRFLRGRCPWDAKQTPQSLRPYLLEEAHEAADAVQGGDDEALEGELGDLLLNVAFQVVLAEERGAFDAGGVVERLERKMEARHPHVYGDATEPPDWEAMKAAERKAAAEREASPDRAAAEGQVPDPFAGVSKGLEPLSRAARVQERMSALGFDWPGLAGPLAKVREEADELARAAAAQPRMGRTAVVEEVGDLLFAAVNAARIAGAHPANALLAAIEKFERRCRLMLREAEARGLKSADALDEIWEDVKRRRTTT